MAPAFLSLVPIPVLTLNLEQVFVWSGGDHSLSLGSSEGGVSAWGGAVADVTPQNEASLKLEVQGPALVLSCSFH